VREKKNNDELPYLSKLSHQILIIEEESHLNSVNL